MDQPISQAQSIAPLPQKKKMKPIFIYIIIVVVLALLAAAYWLFLRPKTNSTNTVSLSNSSEHVAADTTSAPWLNTDIDFENNLITTTGESGELSEVKVPFDLASYNGEATRYGVLFWKRGEIKTIEIPDMEPVEYETGVQPEFRWYDFSKKEFVTLPKKEFTLGDVKFERVYMLLASSTEPKLIIEVGEYDTASKEFAPGIFESQPVKTHGLQYDSAINTLAQADPLSDFLQVIGEKTSLNTGMWWDSKNAIAVAVPSDDGCGYLDTIIFVDLAKKTKQTAGGSGSLTFSKEDCNPKSAFNDEGTMFVLFGKNAAGKLDAYLFTPTSGVKPVKEKQNLEVAEFPSSIDAWEQTGSYPKITFDTGDIIDFSG